MFQSSYLLRCDWFLRCFGKFFLGLGIVSEIILATDQNDGEALTEVQNFRNPLHHSKLMLDIADDNVYLLLNVVE